MVASCSGSVSSLNALLSNDNVMPSCDLFFIMMVGLYTYYTTALVDFKKGVELISVKCMLKLILENLDCHSDLSFLLVRRRDSIIVSYSRENM